MFFLYFRWATWSHIITGKRSPTAKPSCQHRGSNSQSLVVGHPPSHPLTQRPCIFFIPLPQKLPADQQFAHAKSRFFYVVVSFCFLIPQFFSVGNPFICLLQTITLFLFPKAYGFFHFPDFFSYQMAPYSNLTPAIYQFLLHLLCWGKSWWFFCDYF